MVQTSQIVINVSKHQPPAVQFRRSAGPLSLAFLADSMAATGLMGRGECGEWLPGDPGDAAAAASSSSSWARDSTRGLPKGRVPAADPTALASGKDDRCCRMEESHRAGTGLDFTLANLWMSFLNVTIKLTLINEK